MLGVAQGTHGTGLSSSAGKREKLEKLEKLLRKIL